MIVTIFILCSNTFLINIICIICTITIIVISIACTDDNFNDNNSSYMYNVFNNIFYMQYFCF